jgi:hypothetical protein
MIISCMPVDRSDLPQIPELDAVVITDLYTLKVCERCGRDIWVGPRQLAFWKENLSTSVLLCVLCSVEVTPVQSIVDLGGGYPNEGRRRT